MTYKKRPTTLSELKRRVENYFASRLMPVLDKNGNVILDEKGKPVKKIALPYTLTGLALAIGVESREELFNFKDEEMQRYIKMSVLKVEEYAEERLFSKEAFSGVKLFLSVNFDRWKNLDASDSDEGEYLLPESVQKWTV